MKTRLDMQHMADGVDVLSLVSPEQMARIRELDPHPLLRAYAIAHEGVATPNLVGAGRVAVQYFREAVRKIHEKLRAGTPLFGGHGPDNSTEGREVLGEVVGKAMREIGGKLYGIAAVWIRPEHAAKKLDVCSIEANVELTNKDGAYRAVDVGEITGIALGDSGHNSPAFSGATLLAAAQCFAAEGGSMTVKELKEAIAELKVRPSDLFDADTLKSDPTIEAHVKAEKQTEYEHAKRIERKLEAERAENAAKLAEAAKRAEDAEMKSVQSSARAHLDAMATERKLSDQQKAFVARRFSEFKTEAKDEKALKGDLAKFLDVNIEEFSETAKLLGVEQKGGNPPTPADSGGGTDMTVPANNPLIPEG